MKAMWAPRFVYRFYSVAWAFFLSAFSLALFPSYALAATFPDLLSEHDNFTAIENLSERGIIKGYPDGTFQPNREVNRAEALAIILKGLEIADNAETFDEVIFKDVKTDQWFYQFVMNAWRREIVKGYSDGTFKPGQTVNLVESLKMILTAAGVQTDDITFDQLYDGMNPQAWYASYAAFAESKHLIEAGDDGTVHPDQKITRAQLAEIVHRFLYVREHGGAAFDVTTNWYSYQNPANRYQVKYPRGWEFHKGTKNTTFWKRDYLNNQVWYTRLYPNAARVSASYFDNKEGLSAKDYFKKIRSQNDLLFKDQHAQYTETTLSNLPILRFSAPSRNILDLYAYLPDSKILVLYGEWGSGGLARDFERFIPLMYDSFAYLEDTAGHSELNTIAERLEFAREHLLVESKGNEVLKLFPDRRLLSTDTLGVGTGPVDYFYTQEGDVTLKYERGSDVVLDMQNGATTAF